MTNQKELLTVEEFGKLASGNPDTAQDYIFKNEEQLERKGLLEEFDRIVDYWVDMWEGEQYERAQAQAFHERMDYR